MDVLPLQSACDAEGDLYRLDDNVYYCNYSGATYHLLEVKDVCIIRFAMLLSSSK